MNKDDRRFSLHEQIERLRREMSEPMSSDTSSRPPLPPATAGLQTYEELRREREAHVKTQGKLTEAESRLHTLEALEKQLVATQEEVQRQLVQLGQLRGELAEARAKQPTTLRRDLDKAQEQLEEKSKSLETEQAEHAKARHELREATNLLKETGAAYNRAHERAEELEKSLDDAQTANLNLEEQIRQANRAASENERLATDALVVARERKELLDTALDAKRALEERLTTLTEESQQQITGLTKQNERLEENRSRLLRECEAAIGNRERLEEQLCEVNESNANLDRDLKLARSETQAVSEAAERQAQDFRTILELLNGQSDRLERRELAVVGRAEDRPIMAFNVSRLTYEERGEELSLAAAGTPTHSCERLVGCLRKLGLAE